LRHEQSLEVGDRIDIGGQPGMVRTVEPLLGERKVRLVVQLMPDFGKQRPRPPSFTPA
jgi:hypothetical protein